MGGAKRSTWVGVTVFVALIMMPGAIYLGLVAGQGLGSALARRVARFGVEEIRLNRLEILTALGNVASQRVAEKAGATREGVLRSRLILREQVIDAAMFSLTARDFGKEPS